MKKVMLLLAFILGMSMLTGCESWQRNIKSIRSDFTGGLNRTVTVYDYNGKPIKSWTGRFDVEETSADYVYFDMPNGKRVVVHGGILINEEN